MSKIPISHFDCPIHEAFEKILDFHVPEGRILDPTYGEGHLWGGLPRYRPKRPVLTSDLKTGVDFRAYFTDSDHKTFAGAFAGIVFDPPYFFGVPMSTDPREADYGGYDGSLPGLRGLVTLGIEGFKGSLQRNGKLILKCADQYYVPERRLYLHHAYWLQMLELRGYRIIDLFVYRHHRVSPTAWQVKNRQSSVIMHTYFIVAQVD